MHAGDRRHRARRAQQMEPIATLAIGDARRRKAPVLRRHDAVIAAKISGVTSSPPKVSASETTPSRSEFPGLDPARNRPAAPWLRDIQTISEEPPPISNRTVDSRLFVGKFAAAGGSQKGFGLAIDDLERETETLTHLCEELRAVLRGAAGFGGDQPRARDAARPHLVAADLRASSVRAIAASREPAGLRQPLAQPHNSRKSVDDAKAVMGRPRDEQPAIVRAQIQRRIERH